VLNYIKSSAIVSDIGGRPYLEKYFGFDGVDYVSRLGRDEKIEDLVKYWLKRVLVTVDTISGILTLKVEAFRPEDARQIARDIVRLSEQFVNTMTMRSRSDAVERARQEVSLAADKLAGARDRLTEFRDRSALIDPASRAQSVGELIGKLTMDKIGIENSLATVQGSLSSESPTLRVQRAKLASITQQIDDLKNTLTNSHNDTAVSSQIASYERLKLDEQFNQLMYTVAQSSYQRARQELEKQQLYLVVIVPPTLPQSATYPKVIASTGLLFTTLFLFWGIIALIIASIHDQMV
jgi:capsular polysaccharide transport system permease protein